MRRDIWIEIEKLMVKINEDYFNVQCKVASISIGGMVIFYLTIAGEEFETSFKWDCLSEEVLNERILSAGGIKVPHKIFNVFHNVCSDFENNDQLKLYSWRVAGDKMGECGGQLFSVDDLIGMVENEQDGGTILIVDIPQTDSEFSFTIALGDKVEVLRKVGERGYIIFVPHEEPALLDIECWQSDGTSRRYGVLCQGGLEPITYERTKSE